VPSDGKDSRGLRVLLDEFSGKNRDRFKTGFGEPGAVSGEAFRADGTVSRDARDAAVAEPGEVEGGESSARVIIDPDAGEAGMPAINDDRAVAVLHERTDGRQIERDVEDEGAVDEIRVTLDQVRGVVVAAYHGEMHGPAGGVMGVARARGVGDSGENFG
jgi:hypothetical protein